MSTMKLYFVPRTSAGRPRWMLEELGVPFELVTLDASKGETRTPEHKRLHPLGHVPVFVDGDTVMFESAAIVMYLADKYPEKKMAPPLGSPARMHYLQWCVFTLTELLPPLLQAMRHTVFLPAEQRDAKLAEEGRRAGMEALAVIDQALASRPHLLGEEFTAADVLVGGAVMLAGRQPGLLDAFPHLQAYSKRLHDRPALQRSFK